MDLSPRRLPWLLALVGAVHGWSLGHRLEDAPWDERPSDSVEILLAFGFGSALFLAGWLHVQRKAKHRPDLAMAAAKILLCCGALGLIPGLLFGYRTLPFAVLGVPRALAVAVMVLPPALLLIHAYGEIRAPRVGSLFAGADRAEEALSILGAMVLLPWWRSDRPHEVALILALLALPAVAIGLQAVVLSKQMGLLSAAFPDVVAAGSGDATIVCDIGFGTEEREPPPRSLNAYRSNASRQAVACRGSVLRGSCAARRLLFGSLAIGLAAVAQASWLLLGAS